jgi:hypothetical protein
LAQIFSRRANRIPFFTAAILASTGALVIVLFWYYGSPQFIEVGYRPTQPIPYSHKLHAGDLGLDCRYCHSQVEISPAANIPSVQTCMNCHRIIGQDNEKLLPLRESWASGKPIQWVRVHKLPDYVYFNHSAHLRAGVGCVSCHGNIAEMEKVMQVKPLSMGWCLDCHRRPDPHLRPIAEITNMKWKPGSDYSAWVAQFIKERKIAPRDECSACHR